MEGISKLNHINQYLELMIKNKASDMFLTFGENPCLRINTKLIKQTELKVLDEYKLVEIAKELLGNEDKKNLKEGIDLSLLYNERSFRINISKQRGYIMIVIRLLLSKIPNLELSKSGNILKKIIGKPNGIIIVSGPAGSGKTTLMASMIEEINQKESKHIISIEDPIEYVFKSKKSIVEQKELNKDIESFPNALKAAMRQNPDIILFGEMRDKESIRNAITLAETGHLVITTTHARSAGQTISKIIDSFDADYQNQIRGQLSDSLVAVINQRILKNKNFDEIIVAQEIMINNVAIANNIKKNDIKNINNTILTSKKDGMQLLDNNLIELFKEGLIDRETAISNANDTNYLIENLN